MAATMYRDKYGREVWKENIACHSSGNNSLVSAVAGKKIMPVAIFLWVNAAVNFYFVSHPTTGDDTVLIGNGTDLFQFAQAGGFRMSEEWGLKETEVGEALGLNLSSGVSVCGYVHYVLND
jgi:hypothetical protein